MTVEKAHEDMIERVLKGDRRTASQLMRIVDDRAEGHLDLLGALYPHTGRAFTAGIAGSPGCGKSTIVDALIGELRKQAKTVGVVAIDPTSALTGGAILGDRVRMQQHGLDEGVFIRSVATRGAQGGISPSTVDICRIMDAMGMDVVLVETVGVGQDEVDVRMAVNVNVVVLSPDTGDAIQIMKAGIMEIADVFVVNKMDKEGAENVFQELRMFLTMNEATRDTPVVRMEARANQGTQELLQAVLAFREPEERTRLRRRLEIRKRAGEVFTEWFEDRFRDRIDENIERIQRGETTPYEIVGAMKEIMEGFNPKQ
jgi:LAO/AO transport system kinase